MNKNYEWAITSRQDVQRCACAATGEFVPTSNTIASFAALVPNLERKRDKLYLSLARQNGMQIIKVFTQFYYMATLI